MGEKGNGNLIFQSKQHALHIVLPAYLVTSEYLGLSHCIDITWIVGVTLAGARAAHT